VAKSACRLPGRRFFLRPKKTGNDNKIANRTILVHSFVASKSSMTLLIIAAVWKRAKKAHRSRHAP